MTKRILCIDGGGLRGVFAAAIIEQMEKVNRKPAHQIFDCFCGTSAGSLLAAGLADGKTATEMKELFIRLGKHMSALMSAGSGGNGTSDPSGARQKAAEALEALLKEQFEDRTPDQLKRRLAIPSRNMAMGQVVFFGNFPKDQLDEPSFWDDTVANENEPLWKIVRRSAALPPLFSPDGPYLDGGVSPFANPTYAAYEGVQRRLGWNPHRVRLRFYSVGTGYHRKQVHDLAQLSDAALYDAMVDAMMQDINFLQHQVMKRRAGEGTIWYRRYNISFDRRGFERFGLPVTEDTPFPALAATATPLVEDLAAIGTRVGEMSVEEQDFRDLGPLPDRRSGSERRQRPDRRSDESPAAAEAHSGRRASLPRRRRARRVLGAVAAHPSVPERAVS